MVESPYRIQVYNPAFVKQGEIGDYATAQVVLRHNAVGSWTLKFNLDMTEALNLLARPDRRITVDLDERITSGMVTSIRRVRSGREEFVEVTGADDKAWLDYRVGYPDPGASLPADGTVFTQATIFDRRTGDGETVIKGFVTANAVTRLPVPSLSVATNSNRGASVVATARMNTLLEVCSKAAEASGLGLSLVQDSGELVFDVYVPTDQSVRLSQKVGNLKAWEYVLDAPGATRAVVGGRGNETARRFVKQTLASSETDWGIIERFVDAADVELDADLPARGTEYLAENAPTAGFSVNPEDTVAWRFGTDYHLGDKVRAEIPGGFTAVDVIREITLSHEPHSAPVITPTVGNADAANKSTGLYRVVRALAHRIADLEKR